MGLPGFLGHGFIKAPLAPNNTFGLPESFREHGSIKERSQQLGPASMGLVYDFMFGRDLASTVIPLLSIALLLWGFSQI